MMINLTLALVSGTGAATRMEATPVAPGLVVKNPKEKEKRG